MAYLVCKFSRVGAWIMCFTMPRSRSVLSFRPPDCFSGGCPENGSVSLAFVLSGLIQSGRAPSRENVSGLMLVSPSAPGAGVHFVSRSSNYNKCQVNGQTLKF